MSTRKHPNEYEWLIKNDISLIQLAKHATRENHTTCHPRALFLYVSVSTN